MTPTLRKPFGILLLLLYLLLYGTAVASFAGRLGALPVLVQALAYLVLGIVWIVPLKPLFHWMETGHWRAR